MTNLPEARIEHRLPGRLRLRLPAMRGDTVYFRELEEAIATHPGLGSVTVSPTTASVLFEDLELGDRNFARLAREQGWFEVRAPAHRPTGRAARRDVIDPGVKAAMREMRPSLALILVALALLQAARGQLMVPALSLLWFAYVLVQDGQGGSVTLGEWPAAEHSVH